MGPNREQLHVASKQPENQFILNDQYGELNEPAGSVLSVTRGIACCRHEKLGGKHGQFFTAKSADKGP